MADTYDVTISPENEVLSTIQSALGSVQSSAPPQTPTKSKAQTSIFNGPASRGLKAEGSTKRVVTREASYHGSPMSSGRKRSALRLEGSLEESNSSRISSGVGLHGVAPASPGFSSFHFGRVVVRSQSLIRPAASSRPPAQQMDKDEEESSEGGDETAVELSQSGLAAEWLYGSKGLFLGSTSLCLTNFLMAVIEAHAFLKRDNSIYLRCTDKV